MSRNLHPLLKKQLQQFGLSSDASPEFQQFLERISESYQHYDNDQSQLQQSLNIHKKQKKHADIKIENFTKRADNIFNNITEVLFETDMEGNWVYLNPAWEQLTGLPVIDCLGVPFHKYLNNLTAYDRNELTDLIKKEFKSYSKVLEVQMPSGEFLWLDVTIKRLFNDKGVAIGSIGTIWDITAQKQVELSLVEAKEKEAMANRTKDEFLSTISHEIRTPLNAVIGTTHLLLLENPHESQLENLNVLKHSSEHLLSLVNDILDFGKIESGNIELEKIDFDFRNRLNGLLVTYGKLAEENKIGFSINIDDSIPEFLIGDSTRLLQILTNLLSNALKFTQQGEVALNIKVAQQQQDFVTLNFEVIDTGIGIPMEKQAKIFEAFTQANSSTARKFGGTGLGLSICKKLLQLMDSDMTLNSEVGVGSVFSFPLRFGVSKNTYAPTNVSQEMTIAEHSLEGLSVLVAEDNKINILMVKKFLSKWDVVIDIAENGLEAVNKYKAKSHDIILMDLLMPVMNGFEAAKTIREFDKEVPIVALSASTCAHVKEEFNEAGMDGLIGKPFNPNTLFNVLKNLQFAGRANTTYDLGFI